MYIYGYRYSLYRDRYRYMGIGNQNVLSELITSADLEGGNIFLNDNLFCFNFLPTASSKKKKVF